MPAIAPTSTGKKKRAKKPQEEWCSFKGSAAGLRVREDIEQHNWWHDHLPQRQGFGDLLRPEAERRLRREIAKRKQTHTRCPKCGRRLLVSWYPDDGELYPVVPRHKRKA